jgi:hypothetical protein
MSHTDRYLIRNVFVAIAVTIAMRVSYRVSSVVGGVAGRLEIGALHEKAGPSVRSRASRSRVSSNAVRDWLEPYRRFASRWNPGHERLRRKARTRQTPVTSKLELSA